MPYSPAEHEKYLRGHGLRWNITLPLGRDPETGKLVHHYKSLHGLKRDAQTYLDWYAGLVVAGKTPTETIAQWELKQLFDLQSKADKFKEKLLAKVQSGVKVQPGPLTLADLGSDPRADAAGLSVGEARL